MPKVYSHESNTIQITHLNEPYVYITQPHSMYRKKEWYDVVDESSQSVATPTICRKSMIRASNCVFASLSEKKTADNVLNEIDRSRYRLAEPTLVFGFFHLLEDLLSR